jgi:hypothetical protein
MTLTGRPGRDGHGDGAVPIRLSGDLWFPSPLHSGQPVPPFAKEPCRSHEVPPAPRPKASFQQTDLDQPTCVLKPQQNGRRSPPRPIEVLSYGVRHRILDYKP